MEWIDGEERVDEVEWIGGGERVDEVEWIGGEERMDEVERRGWMRWSHSRRKFFSSKDNMQSALTPALIDSERLE